MLAAATLTPVTNTTGDVVWQAYGTSGVSKQHRMLRCSRICTKLRYCKLSITVWGANTPTGRRNDQPVKDSGPPFGEEAMVASAIPSPLEVRTPDGYGQ